MSLSMITGNATDDGAPIYLSRDGTWTRSLIEGWAAATEVLKEVLAGCKAQQRIVCDVYLIDVVVAEGRPAPTTVRERFRASGPTVLLPIARALAA